MKLTIVIASMLMACCWLGYSVAAFGIVLADSVGAGSTYFAGPGFGMFFVSLITILLPSGIFGRRVLVVVVGLLLTASIAISPWLYAGSDPANVRPWLQFGSIGLIVTGAYTSTRGPQAG
jgi:hypothetical protein